MAKVYAVGIGPGGREYMTQEAAAALEAAEVLCGYPVYLELVAPYFRGKELLSTPMTKETERCRMALEAAQQGKTVAMVCSGDSGVYGMAGLLLELTGEYPGTEVEVVCGVTAALSGGAVLGAPLGHDFCVISLSDLLTPWDVIEKRLRCAAEADFAVCLYNPGSHKRAGYLRKACEILLEKKAPETVCGIVRNIGREGQEKRLLSLDELKDTPVDMFTTVFIGSSGTENIRGSMVTRRGYHKKKTPESAAGEENG